MVDPELRVFEKVRETWTRLDHWRARLSAGFYPADGSDLAEDDTDWPPKPVSQVAWVGLASAVMHLHGMRLHLDSPVGRRPELVPFAQLSLGRGALIGAAQAVWVLSSDERETRLRRSRTVTRYFLAEHRKYLTDLEPASAETNRTLPVVKAHVEQRLAELDRKRAGLGQRASLNATEMVKAAAYATFTDPATVGELSALWRLGSAAAHGLMWSELGGADGRVPTARELASHSPAAEEAVLEEMSAGGDMVRSGNLYLAAYQVAMKGWRLMGARGGVDLGPCVS